MDEKGHRGRRGRAPVASLEDLSDESPEDKSRLALPGIREAEAGRMTTPRIDISRASSSSHQEDSSPERELLAGEGPPTKLGLGFAEEMAQELRSSTEELDFQDPEDQETRVRRKKLQSQQAVLKYDLETNEKEAVERKDSACSEGGFLIIGGRTSRLSSIGSAASGGSVASALSCGSAVSGASVASRLSAASNYSRASRCSSPHRLMLETSFCGPKPVASLSIEAKDPEAAILTREIDPTDAVLPKMYQGKTKLDVKAKSSAQKGASPESRQRRPKRTRPKKKQDEDALVRIIPLHGSVDEPASDGEDQAPEEEASTSAVASDKPLPEDGIYIPLKGPDLGRPDRPKMDRREARAREAARTAQVEAFRREDRERTGGAGSSTSDPQIDGDLVRFISLHGDDDETSPARREPSQNRNGHNVQFKPWTEEDPIALRRKARTPEPGGKSSTHRIELASKHGTRTPSPASSFRTVFRRSSDSSSSSKRSSQGTDSLHGRRDSKNKSLFGSFFKKSPREKSSQSSQHSSQSITSTEIRSSNLKQEKKPAEPDQIIIPLHSPDSVVEPLIVVEPASVASKSPVQEIVPLRSCQDEPTVGPQEVSSKVAETMAINVVVVDVLNEDKIVAFENLQRDQSAESVKEAEHSTVTNKRRQEVIKTEDNHLTKAAPPKKENIELSNVPSSIGIRVPEEETSISPEKELVKSQGSSPSKDISPLSPEELDTSKVISDESTAASGQDIVRSESSHSGFANSIGDRMTNSLEECLAKEGEESSLAQRSTTTESSEITIIENHFIGKGEDEDERKSSESEMDPSKEKELSTSIEDDTERKSLFQQTDSVEEELPYVPTTLPQERSVGVLILPVKQRVSEIKTCPIERPRSTTPIIPTCLDDYYTSHDESSTSSSSSGKMQIVLPRSDSMKSNKQKGGGAKPWSVFAGECLQSPKEARRTAPPLPPRSAGWVCFDDAPERQRAPRRITTLPRPGPSSAPHSAVLYSYVNPEECSCECHDTPKHCSQIKH